MIDEAEVHAIPPDQVPLGWEPLADYGKDLDGATSQHRDNLRQPRDSLLVIHGGRYSVWIQTHKNWPFP